MARQRKNGNTPNSSSKTTSTSSTSAISSQNSQKAKILKQNVNQEPATTDHFLPSSNFILDKWKTLIGCICLATASYFCYLGYLETRVNTAFDNQKTAIGLDDAERYWGTYRPGAYFGLKTRDPHSLVMGLMWYAPQNLGHGGRGIRHWCEISDNLAKYGWIRHDGRTFGVQEIHDLPFEIKTSFVKYPAGKQYGGDWTSRISVRNISIAWDKTISLIWYVALDEKTIGHIRYVSDEKSPESGVYGETSGLGEFRLRFHPIKGRILHKSYLSTVAPSLSELRETVFTHFRVFTTKNGNKYIGLPGEMVSSSAGHVADPNFIAIQITGESDFTMDITYQSTSGFTPGDKNIPKPPIAREFTDSLQQKIEQFDKRFEETYHLRAKGFSSDEIKFAKAALSNMIGGIGYFYGASRVQSIYTKNPVPYWKAPLYTAVPSRSFFPRGFLWDEGFHGLLISSWDLDIELDILCHWMDLINIEGWIPREQILGSEALAKVPAEFVIQRNTNANPPTFFLTLKTILTHHRRELSEKGRIGILERLYPRLHAWFTWLNTTQRGELMGTYRWRGRDTYNDEKELNPKTLTSGLDDFPRASHPTPQERHVDLRCWVAFAASVMSDLSTLIGKDDLKYYETAAFLSDNHLLNRQHLSPNTETYADWGLHTDAVVLKRRQLATTKKNLNQQQSELVRVTQKPPEYQFVDTTFGYINLFPLLLEILEPDSPHLGKMLDDMRDPNILWTDFGLRSLSKQSPLYMKSNTEKDPPYWRGQIWININYLVLKALQHYSEIDGPYAGSARKIYSELRDNLIRNLFKEYQKTGYIWEQYDDSTGKGRGCYPFTGWSSLVVLIMSEQY